MCELFEVARSSYHYRIKNKGKVNLDRERLKKRIIEIHTEGREAPGSRSIAGKLNQEGENIGRTKTSNIMKEADIKSKQPGKSKHKDTGGESKIAPNLLKREFNVSKENQIWCGDVTYIWAGDQWLYLAVVMDLYKRKIVGWACSDSPNTDLTCAALRVAYESRGKPKDVIFHSDQGCHYTSLQYRQNLWEYQITQSMSRRGNCWDNAVMESFYSRLKVELIYAEQYRSIDEARSGIFEYIEVFYNRLRRHSALGYVSL